MAEDRAAVEHLQTWLGRLAAGENGALEELIRHTGVRLEKLTRHMLRGHPAVHRWAQTEDVLQGALVRLLRALRELRPGSPGEFFALAAQQIRRELLDLARHSHGPQGIGANHASDPGRTVGEPAPEPADESLDGSALAEWTELHLQIEALPQEQRQVVDLLYYQGLSQPEAALLLGVAVRTVQRRWHDALLRLHELWKGEWPGT
jgi:RNA polymerase sigma factor (sigma-70 family)